MSLSIDEVLAVDYPGAPSWSADGRFLAVPIYEDDARGLSVLAAPEASPASATDGDEYTELSAGGSDADPLAFDAGVVTFAWAPEPTPARMAVLTDEPALYLVNAARETTERLTTDVDADDLAWDDHGRRLAFYRDGRPTVYDVDDGDDRRFDVPERGGFLGEETMLAFHDDLLAYRFEGSGSKDVGVVDVSANEKGRVAADEESRVAADELLAADEDDLVWRTRGPASASDPAWLADGRVIVDRSSDWGTVREIVAADPRDGSEEVIFREEDERGVVSRGAPTVSPDGTRLAITLPLDGWEHVYLLDPASGELTQLTDGSFEDKGLAGSRPRWLDDDTLVFASDRRASGQRQLFAVDVADRAASIVDVADGSGVGGSGGTGGTVTPLVTSEGTNVHPRPAPDGDRLAYVHADREVSAEVRVVDLSEGSAADADPSRVTRSAVRDWDVDPIEPEEVVVEGPGGVDVHSYLLDPRGEVEGVPADAEGLPAVVWVHGGPMRQMRDGWHPGRSYGIAYTVMQYLARQGYVGLMVNYRGGIGYGKAFRQALVGARGRDEMADIVAATRAIEDRPFVDPDNVGIWGLSYGGYATLQLLGTHPDEYAVGVNIAGLADLELYRDWAEVTKYPAVASAMHLRIGGEPWSAPEEWAEASPVTHFENYDAPLYSYHGTGDRYVNVAQQDLVVEELLGSDVEFEFEYYPDENHVFSERAVWERVLGQIESAFDEHLT